MPPKRRSAAKEQPSLADAFLHLSASVSKQAREPNILAYEPHAKQLAFHKSTDYIRAYIGGNRSGKTFGAIAEDIYHLNGVHPYQKVPPGPIRGRVVAVDLTKGVNEIVLPIFSRLLTPSMLINGSWEDSYQASIRVLTLANGSYVEFMSYEMDTEKFAGTSRHFIHYDEEPPKRIYDECQARLVDTEGRAWLSMTPVDGITWVFEKIYEPVNEAADKEILIPGSALIGPAYRSAALETTIVEVGMNENPHLSVKAQARYLATLDEDSRKARSRGEFVQVSGKIFPNFTEATHVLAPVANPALTFKGWAIYSSVDHGWNNPTAWLWHAVSPDGDVVTFGEHYADKMTVADHAATVLAKEAAWGITVDMRTGDPAMKQTSAITGTSIIEEYANGGIYISVDNVPRAVSIGIAKMQRYLKIEVSGKTHWKITKECENFIREMKKLRFKSYTSSKMRDENNKQEEVHKKDDHTFDSARYFATALPDLSPEAIITKSVIERAVGLRYDEALGLAIDNRVNADGWTVLESYS